jgi:hypothetical protein
LRHDPPEDHITAAELLERLLSDRRMDLLTVTRDTKGYTLFGPDSHGGWTRIPAARLEAVIELALGLAGPRSQDASVKAPRPGRVATRAPWLLYDEGDSGAVCGAAPCSAISHIFCLTSALGRPRLSRPTKCGPTPERPSAAALTPPCSEE